jgi:hypothetical protein
MTAIVLVIVAATLLGLSPGLALIFVALAVFAFDAYDPSFLNSLTRAFADD